MIADVLADVNLLEHVPPSANLRQVGRDTWRGRCPIGDHAAGAFSVKRGPRGHLIFMCFSCGAKGDVINLVAALDGITTAEAVKRLSKGSVQLTPEDRLAKLADAWRARQPAYAVLCCSLPGCHATKGADSVDDLAEALVYGRWWADKAGTIVLCPQHATQKAYRAVVADRPLDERKAA